MGYVLRSDGVNDVVSIASAITISSLGTQAWTFCYKGNIATPTGTIGIVGTSSSSTVAGPAVNTTGQMIIRSSANIAVATSPTGFIIFGEDHKYECDHLAGGAISWKRDDIEIGTGSYTGSQSWTNLNQFFRATSAATARLAADTEYIEFIGTVNANKWDANLSGGTGNVLPTTNELNQGTLINFTVPDCWIFYSTGTSWQGTIGKTSLTLVNDQLFVALGYDITSGKQSLSLSSKQQSVSVGFNSTTNKTALSIGNKQEILLAGQVLTLNKQSLPLSNKPLSVIAGSSVSFTGLLNKLSLTPSFKQLSLSAGSNLSLNKGVLSQAPKLLSISAGFNTTSNKQSLVVGSKQESISVGQVLTFEEQNLVVGSKQLNVSVGTTVSFVGELQKTGLNATGKPLSVSAGTSVSFDGLINKTSLSLSGKVLDTIRGQVLDLQKRSISLLGKQLALGEAVYPIIPIERIFTLEDKGRVYVMKQETTIYLMSNKSSVHIMKGK